MGGRTMTRIGDNLRPVLAARLDQARRRRETATRLRRGAELDWRRGLHPEQDAFAPRDAGWSRDTLDARERFRRAHALEVRARDAEAALEDALEPVWM